MGEKKTRQPAKRLSAKLWSSNTLYCKAGGQGLRYGDSAALSAYLISGMTPRRLFGLILLLPLLALPQLALASHDDDDDTARLFVYVRTVNTSGPAMDPWRFQVSVTGDADAHPYRFEGSANGTIVDIDADEEYEVTVSERYDYDARYSGKCEGELNENETASCFITLAAEGGAYYPGAFVPNYPQPVYPGPVVQPSAPVSLIQNYIPSALPNTGFDPSLGSAIVAFTLVFMLGAGVAAYPYVRKIAVALR
jgi:hypothetical protein